MYVVQAHYIRRKIPRVRRFTRYIILCIWIWYTYICGYLYIYTNYCSLFHFTAKTIWRYFQFFPKNYQTIMSNEFSNRYRVNLGCNVHVVARLICNSTYNTKGVHVCHSICNCWNNNKKSWIFCTPRSSAPPKMQSALNITPSAQCFISNRRIT